MLLGSCLESRSKLSFLLSRSRAMRLITNRAIYPIPTPLFLNKLNTSCHPPQFCSQRQKHPLGKDNLLNKWRWLNWISTCKRMKIDSYILPCIKKINSKWIKVIFEQSSISTGTNHQSNRWTYTKIKDFCPTKETLSRAHRQPGEWERIFTSYDSEKGLIFMIKKNCIN